MAYQINKTDGTVVATVADGQIDTLSTDLTLIGKNYSGFGEALNENFIKLLENFSSTTRPNNPIRGQIWFDSSEQKLKVYSGTTFVPVSSATISTTQPTTLGIGDLWYDETNEQLFFFDGVNPVLISPAYSASQGKSGIEVQSILDTLNQTRVITLLYNNGILLGIFAKDSFTPKNAITGFSGTIQPGFNAGSLAGIKFNVTCTNSEQLGGTLATTYVRKDTANQVEGQFRINTDLGLILGSAGQGSFTVSSGNVLIANTASDKDMKLNVRKGISQETAVAIGTAARTIDFYSGFADSVSTFGGSVVVTGNLTVQGDTTTIDVATLTVEDKTINLASQTGVTPTDENASGGGVILEGATKHVLIWSQTNETGDPELPDLLSGAWNSSDHLNLAQNKYFAIDSTPVIEQTGTAPKTFRLSASVTAIPGVTSFGTQETLNVGPSGIDTIRITTNRISTETSNTDLEIAPNGSGNIVLIGSPKITGMADPTLAQDAATKEYVDATIESRDVVFSMDLSDGKSNGYIITNILNNIAPAAYYRVGTYARILCTQIANSTGSLDINALVSKSQSPFLTDLSGTTGNALTNVSVATATVPAPSISTTRIIKVFQLLISGWSHQSDIPLPP
jgi:hypothetical protein